jgi:hypothetical protein
VRQLIATCLLICFCSQPPNALAQAQSIPISAIDFYGYGGIDIEKLRTALPVHVGDTFPSFEAERANSPKIRAVVLQMTGKPAVSVNNVLIEGAFLIYIGLSGTTMKKFPLNPEPTGTAQLPQELVQLYDQKMAILPKAIAAGAKDDESAGYAISSFPELRSKELAIRDYAAQHEDLIRTVLGGASDANQRIVASDALGYAKESRSQIEALVRASHDSNSVVRNNATRALGVLASSDPKIAADIPAEPFIEMLSSESWTDRNKAGWVLQSITSTRNPKVLAELRSQAIEPLIEMAKWHDNGHAGSFRTILGRIGGIEEARLKEMADKNEQVDAIIAAARSAK